MTNFDLNDNTTIPVTGFGVFMVPNNGPTEEAVTTALKEGYRLIDTAAAYQNESDVGKAVKKSGIPREEIYVTSKLWLQDYGYEAAKKAIDTSLSKLGLDYMDLYLLHQPYGDTAGAWKALEDAVRAGKIRSIGLSNHTVRFLDKLLPKMEILPVVNQMECNPYFQQKELREYLPKYNIRMEAWYPLGHANRQLLTDDGLIRGWGLSQVDVDVIDAAQSVTPLTAIQNIYSMVERDCERRIIPYCMEHGIGFVPFSPIASGLLSGKITAETQFERNDDVRNWVPQLSRRNIEGNMPIVEMLKEFADREKATPAQISLAWMLHKYPNVVPIPGSKNKERIIENMNAADVELTDEEFKALDSELNKHKVYGHRGLGGF